MSTLPSSSSLLSSTIDFLGLDDARLSPSDWNFEQNPFWTTFTLTLVTFPCLFYLTWFLNPSLSKNRLGLSWVMGFYSATLFTIAGLYEVPHLRTIFNSAVDYQPAAAVVASTVSSVVGPAISSYTKAATTATTSSSLTSVDVVHLTASATDVCYPLLKASALALISTLPSFLKLDSESRAKYYCFSDFGWTIQSLNTLNSNTLNSNTFNSNTFFNASSSTSSSSSKINHNAAETPASAEAAYSSAQKNPSVTIATPHTTTQAHTRAHFRSAKEGGQMSLRHRVFQGQMQRPHLVFSLENYPDDGRLGPHIVAANFQAFLVVDLVLGLIHYRKQLEPFSTVIHHIIYYFIVVHMRAGDMLSVFCICGTPIEASSIFLAFGRMFPHRRTKTVERLYLLCFISTRLIYVALLWHEIYFNYPDKSVSFLYTITILLHVYWFVLYIKTQRKFQAKQRRQQLCSVLQSLAHAAQDEFVASTFQNAKISSVAVHSIIYDATKSSSVEQESLERHRIKRASSSERFVEGENRASVELDVRDKARPGIATRDTTTRRGTRKL
ncbi:hypothetical protein EDD11_001817 [Mortierella claussenii]|nr:hypothetical protein EDD11_001817 [Mortierella claussenii]